MSDTTATPSGDESEASEETTAAEAPAVEEVKPQTRVGDTPKQVIFVQPPAV